MAVTIWHPIWQARTQLDCKDRRSDVKNTRLKKKFSWWNDVLLKSISACLIICFTSDHQTFCKFSEIRLFVSGIELRTFQSSSPAVTAIPGPQSVVESFGAESCRRNGYRHSVYRRVDPVSPPATSWTWVFCQTVNNNNDWSNGIQNSEIFLQFSGISKNASFPQLPALIIKNFIIFLSLQRICRTVNNIVKCNAK